MSAPLAGIVRVSKMGARTASSDRFHADEEQVNATETYARELGQPVEFLPPELDISGGKPIKERPSLQAAIEGVEDGRYSGIIVAYLSRLTRSRSGLEIWDRVEAAGGHVYTARERLDTSTAIGRRIRDLHLSDAVYEREQKGEDWAKRRAGSVAAGIWCAPNVPPGYDKGPDRRLVPNERAGEVLTWFQRRAAGEPLFTIAKSAGMDAGTLRAILRNRVYLGELHDGDIEPNRSAHPHIVDRKTWEQCQAWKPRPPRSPDLEVSPLAGIARCASCGRILSRANGRRGPRAPDRYRTFACPSYKTGNGCDAPTTIMEDRLVEWVEAEFARPTYEEMKTLGQRDNADREQAAVDSARAELDAWVENVSASSPSYAQGLEVRERRLEEAEAALSAKLAALPSLPLTGSYDDLSAAGRNRWLRGWLGGVYVQRSPGRGVRLPVGERVAAVMTLSGSVLHGDGEAVAGVLAA